MDNLEDTFCNQAFASFRTIPSGHLSLCCSSYDLPKENGKPIFVFEGERTPTDFLNNEFHREIRKRMIAGERPLACANCWRQEEVGGHSLRKSFNQMHVEDKAQLLRQTDSDGTINNGFFNDVDLNLGNICNLKCMMCNPYSSHLIYDEEVSLGILSSEHKAPRVTMWKDAAQFRKFVEPLLKKCTHLNIIGGEPFINPRHADLLQIAEAVGRKDQIELSYNTNLMVLPEDVVKAWDGFKRISVSVSLEGVGAINDYIRYHSKWAVIEENLKKLLGLSRRLPMYISVTSTFSALNALSVTDLYQWLLEFSNSGEVWPIPFSVVVSEPAWARPRVLPEELKRLSRERHYKFFERLDRQKFNDNELRLLDSLKGNLRSLDDAPSENSEDNWRSFKVRVKRLDKHRNQSLIKIIPEFAPFWD